MQASYQLQGNDLNMNFLDSIKNLFQNREIEIIIHDIEEDDKRFGEILDYTYSNSKAVSEDSFLRALSEN
ncbi:MAG: hypothetical protein L0Y61_06685 [Epsilonproteobacteria bacterium]|nr:hypothetical protein [Campylobacterota bacterium]